MPEEDTRQTNVGLLVLLSLVLTGVLGCSGRESPTAPRQLDKITLTAVSGRSLILNLEDQARWMVWSEAGSTRPGPDFMDFIYADELQAVRPDAVRIAGK